MFDVLLLATALMSVGVLLSRLRVLEKERARLRARAAVDHAASPEGETMSALGLLTDEMRHMIVSPLTVILGQCELARNGGELPRRIETIERQARRISDVVERFVCIGKENRGDSGELDPGELAREVTASLQGLAFERDVRIHEMIDECPPLRANPALLRHALKHLLKTAINAAPVGVGDVTLAVGELPAKDGPGHIGFAVADDGPGIEPEDLPRVFHPVPAGGDVSGADGLSYAVVYAIARATGGTVVIDSAPGAGTRATLKVPLTRPVPTATAQPPALLAEGE